jgi:hypothetical protein
VKKTNKGENKMFNFFRKNKEDNEKMTTLEQIRKAYEDLSDEDKKAFHQSIADRVHESIAAQEKADGDEDSQSAADREHEALGAEHADGEGDVSEIGETDATDEKREEEIESAENEWRKRADERLKKIEDFIESQMKRGSDEEEALKKAKDVYGLHGGVFSPEANDKTDISPKEAAELIRKFK